MDYQRIDQAGALEMIRNENAVVVDIRDPASFRSGHIAGALHLDNRNVAEFIATADRAGPVIVCCYLGNTSQDAARFLAAQGFERCYSLDGGFKGWRLSGNPEE